MRITRVLLRWYRSFNVNYLGYDDRRSGVLERPWNKLGFDSANSSSQFPWTEPGMSEEAYRFIEIPIQGDITTIVGGNESGKSHLISAISHVVEGVGIPDSEGQRHPFDFTDLCYYSPVRKPTIDDWPNIGLEFASTAEEVASIAELVGVRAAGATDFVLVLTGAECGVVFLGGEQATVEKEKLTELRKRLPKVSFIQSKRPMSDRVEIADLLAAIKKEKLSSHSYYPLDVSRSAVAFVESLTLQHDKPPGTAIAESLTELKQRLADGKEQHKAKVDLELQLFRDVLEVQPSTLEGLAKLGRKSRSYVEGLIALWNGQIDRVLNLSRYWQQDDEFQLTMNYKEGVFFFEVRDRTGAVYTFKERSSGLRYFLSYYIQAKAIECVATNRPQLVLMDEPDSFLSILGQKNLMAVFESMVGQNIDSNMQLIYTTHSPFLINKNFPNRIRLVRKGDAEEGTQYISESRVRRYEPVRSALGVDCAQTLFMGETNVVVEGPTDQYFISEIIRIWSRHGRIEELLDLNSVVFMSAESAPAVKKVLLASRWTDELIPPTVVMFDGDDEGVEQRVVVTTKQDGDRPLIPLEFVHLIGELVEDTELVITTEDLLPPSAFKEAVKQYVHRWYPEKTAELDKLDLSSGGGVAKQTLAFFNKHIFPSKRKDYDKMGVLQEAVALLEAHLDGEATELDENDVKTLQSRLEALCGNLRRSIEDARAESKKKSVSQAVRRVVLDFFKQFKTNAPTFDVVIVLERIARMAAEVGDDARQLTNAVDSMLDIARELRSRGKTEIGHDNWDQWGTALWEIKNHPLNPAPVGLLTPEADGGGEAKAEMPPNDGDDLAASNDDKPSTTDPDDAEH